MLTDYQDSCSRVSDFGLSWNCQSIVYLSSQDELCIPQLSCFGIQLRYTSRCSSPPLFVHPHHLNCVLLDPGSGCASPLSIDGICVLCCHLVDFKNLNGPSLTDGVRLLQSHWFDWIFHSISMFYHAPCHLNLSQCPGDTPKLQCDTEMPMHQFN